MTSFFQRLDGSACNDLQISSSKVLGAIGRSCDSVLNSEHDWCGGMSDSHSANQVAVIVPVRCATPTRTDVASQRSVQ
jgi:hypothetical protein